MVGDGGGGNGDNVNVALGGGGKEDGMMMRRGEGKLLPPGLILMVWGF